MAVAAGAIIAGSIRKLANESWVGVKLAHSEVFTPRQQSWLEQQQSRERTDASASDATGMGEPALSIPSRDIAP